MAKAELNPSLTTNVALRSISKTPEVIDTPMRHEAMQCVCLQDTGSSCTLAAVITHRQREQYRPVPYRTACVCCQASHTRMCQKWGQKCITFPGRVSDKARASVITYACMHARYTCISFCSLEQKEAVIKAPSFSLWRQKWAEGVHGRIWLPWPHSTLTHNRNSP